MTTAVPLPLPLLEPMPAPEGRFLIAFDDPVLEPLPTWTRLDTDSLVASYSIDRGRQYELDRTDVGRATVQITDRDGVLDPTNIDGPYYGKIEPLLPATIGRYNPVTEEWFTRYRGFVEEYDYSFDPSQRVNRLTVTLVDIFEILSAIKMFPGVFGSGTIPGDSTGQVYFGADDMDARIFAILDAAGIPPELRVVFSGNVIVRSAVYSPGESAMTAVQEAADAEFPGVSNVYTDRFGRLAVHGRLSKFIPEVVSAGASIGAWDWTHWYAGDSAAVAEAVEPTAQIRRFAANRGLAKVVNQALATPVGIADENVEDQLVRDDASIAQYGIRSWEAQNLLTLSGEIDDTTALEETHRFAEYYVGNFSQPRNRVTDIAFRTMDPSWTGAAATWDLLSRIDISDQVDVSVSSPGGGGLIALEYFVEGIHEEVRPLNPVYDDITLSLDLSPRGYYEHNPWDPDA